MTDAYLNSRRISNPFASKLTFTFRCAIFADHVHRGTSYPILAKAFAVNEQTVSKICRSKNSRLYHSVFAEFQRLGIEQMWRQHVEEGGVLPRIDDAAWQRKVGTNAPLNSYVDSGPGRYWVKDSRGGTMEIRIKAYDEIKEEIKEEFGAEMKRGFWVFHPQFGWTVFIGQPFDSVAEALRYFAEFPPMA
jgi:hypothetical protein